MLNGNCGVVLKKGSANNVVQNVNLEQKISAPVEKGQKIGQVTYTLDGKLLQTVDVISDKEVKKENLMNVVSYIYERWFCLLR